MSEVSKQREPSIEDILSSIRRAMAEEEEIAPHARFAASRRSGSPRPPSAGEAPTMTDETPAPDSETVPQAEAATVAAEPSAAPQQVSTPSPSQPAPEPRNVVVEDYESLISASSAAASVAALSELMSLGRRDRGGDLPYGGGRSPEDLATELLRPMVKNWLDKSLPRIIERLVRDEVTRLVREAQGR